MKENSWEFVRDTDGTYSVFHKDELLLSGIPNEYLQRELCVQYGFCGDEFQQVLDGLKASDRCRIIL